MEGAARQEATCSGRGFDCTTIPQNSVSSRGAQSARPGPITQGAVVARDDNSESSPNSILWLWIPDLRSASLRLSGTTAEREATATT
jgi:hypothetical protein